VLVFYKNSNRNKSPQALFVVIFYCRQNFLLKSLALTLAIFPKRAILNGGTERMQ
jgi:hypothetical protein